MTAASDNPVEIRIGGDVSGPVIVGNGNHVGLGNPAPGPAGPSQTNTAKDHGTVYAVTNGDMHVHHDSGPQGSGPQDAEVPEAP
ncbi:hypothetical protein [Streptomyces sp. G-G2]|uniref:hypothetical protein n=1 Tax=Streptomyces sp. G-G2 TaxID=3046201 RepID=UPI0024B8EDAD|nr:hypothetical protein [Streptomyces sp. G-G2]MDJ0379333.1 hypothetical protein [Streptomyces sp. G-G2]